MIDLHTHTVFSDGQLTPAELVRQTEVLGLQGVALTDHADTSSLDFIVPRVRAFCDQANRHQRIRALAGIELTYVPPPLIAELTGRARELGAQIVVVHGETITGVTSLPSDRNPEGPHFRLAKKLQRGCRRAKLMPPGCGPEKGPIGVTDRNHRGFHEG